MWSTLVLVMVVSAATTTVLATYSETGECQVMNVIKYQLMYLLCTCRYIGRYMCV